MGRYHLDKALHTAQVPLDARINMPSFTNSPIVRDEPFVVCFRNGHTRRRTTTAQARNVSPMILFNTGDERSFKAELFKYIHLPGANISLEGEEVGRT